jgi:hypothetical protein
MIPHFALEEIEFRNRYRCSPEMAICVTLSRLSAPSRYKEHMQLFQRSRSWLSMVFNDVVIHLITRYVDKLNWDERRLSRDNLLRYAVKVHQAGGGHTIWGFIDGTMRAICRPKRNQRLYYSGYKKCHAIKFQAVTTPDGLMSHLSGPWQGRVGDYRMYLDSGLQERLRAVNQDENWVDDEEQRLYIYGDSAYGLSDGCMSAYKAQPGRPLNPILREVNTQMSALRVSMEYEFGRTMMLWSFNGFKHDLKIGISPAAAYFMVAVLFCNIHSCFHGNQTSVQYDCPPPSVELYLSLHI